MYRQLFFLLSFLWMGLVFSQINILTSEFIYNNSPTNSCHASTIVQLKSGSIAVAWFGGKKEGAKDVGIWFSKKQNKTWSNPKKVAFDPRCPCWNPVLYSTNSGELLLFYKVGKNPRVWHGMMKRSFDGGKSWTKEEKLPDGILGPIKNKPILSPEGDLICGSSRESHDKDVSYVEITKDNGKTWEKSAQVSFPQLYGVIQPTLFYDNNGHIRMLCRPRRGLRFLSMSKSKDGGRTWSNLEVTNLPNPDSGVDAVRLKDGRILLIYNHLLASRKRLDLAISKNGGDSWIHIATLENEKGEFSYPAMIQTEDGKVHISYTWNRNKIKYIEMDTSILENTTNVYKSIILDVNEERLIKNIDKKSYAEKNN